jgi:IclR family acetate operon transcriptional repressor
MRQVLSKDLTVAVEEGSLCVMDETRRPTLISSVQRALHLVEAVASHPNGAPAKQLARETRLPLATCYHLLRTLAHEGYVNKLSDGVWILGDRFEALRCQGRTQALLARIRPTMIALRDELNTAAYFSLFDEGEIRIIDIADGPRTPRVDLWVGFDEAAHATAIGKCVLGQLDDETRRDYLGRHPLVDLTPNTITEMRELLRNLDVEPGLSLDREEYALGTGCVAVPVTTPGGDVVGALAVSSRVSRLPMIEASADRLKHSAARITRTLSLTI